MLRKLSVFALGAAALGLVVVAGCDNATNKPAQSQAAAPSAAPVIQAPVPAASEAHTHKPGGHGGNIVEIGRDNYHAEAVFEKGGDLRLYTLGNDEAKVQEIESQVLTAYAKADGANDATPFDLKPAPQAGDAEGKTSQFIGKLPADAVGKQVEVTIPIIKIAGERFRVGFSSASAAHDEGMPAKVSNEEERKLYMTAGGKYTEADIRANGNMTASQKFKGAMAAHNLSPQPGEKICPITLTKANPKFTWVVGGKSYEFCCPPCVDEFVKTAKEHPDQIKEPGDYVKQ